MRTEAPTISFYHGVLNRPNRSNLRDVSIELRPETWNEVVGQSGAGKTSLFLQLSLREKTDGSLLIRGQNVARMTTTDLAKARRDMGSCSELPLFISTLSMAENLQLVSSVRGVEPDLKIIEELDLEHRLKARPDELSRDELLGFGAARAVSHDPQFVAMDGLFDGLSSERSEVIFNRLDLLRRRGATLLVLGRKKTGRTADSSWVLDESLTTTDVE